MSFVQNNAHRVCTFSRISFHSENGKLIQFHKSHMPYGLSLVVWHEISHRKREEDRIERRSHTTENKGEYWKKKVKKKNKIRIQALYAFLCLRQTTYIY